jgi:anti-anti-sigma factor
MEIGVEQSRPGVHLVTFRGELDTAQGEAVREKLHPLVGERGSAIIIDLSKVPTMDSAGLNHLIGVATHARLSGSRVILVSPTPFVAGLFEMTKLDTWIEVSPNLRDAEARVA